MSTTGTEGRGIARWIVWGLAQLLLVALIGYVALAATGRWTVLGELASQFRFYFGFVALAAFVAFALVRHWRKAALAVALVWWGFWPVGVLSWGRPAPAGTPAFHMVCSNVLRPNTRYAEVFDKLLESDPDVIGFLEFSPDWRAAAIEKLAASHPHHVEALNTLDWNSHTWGLMLFSKTEFTSSEVLRLDFDEWALRPVLQATLAAPLDLTITLAHPERPGKPARMRARRLALETIAASRHEGHIQGNWLVIGDLNTTSTSPLFQDLLEATDLRDSRKGFGRQPSWGFGERLPGPFPLPLPGWLRLSVAIDHALCSEGLTVLDRKTLTIPGSDHRAVSVKLSAP